MLLPLRDDNPTVRTPLVTYALIGINTAVMILLSTLSPLDREVEIIKHGFIPERIAQLKHPDLVVRVPIEADEDAHLAPMGRRNGPVEVVELHGSPLGIALTALTSLFLHGGWLHLAGNMWFLWIFGNNVEDRLGSGLYLGFYLIGGLLATACHWAYDPASNVPVVGASGAIATILGAYAVTYPKARVQTLVFIGIITVIEVPAMVWLGLWFVGELVAAFLQQDMGVAVWAHIGGFAIGAAAMPILTRLVSDRRPRPSEPFDSPGPDIPIHWQ